MMLLRKIPVLEVLLAFLIVQNCLATDCQDQSNLDDLSQDKFIEYLTDPCRYDKFVIPNPLDVTTKLAVTHLEAAQTQFTVHLATQLSYQDKNLDFHQLSPKRYMIKGDDSLKNKIWTPNLSLKDDTSIKVLDTSQKDIHLTIREDGVVTYRYKMIVKFNCWLNFQKFPFDYQECNLAFSDWSYNTSFLLFKWDEDTPFSILKNLQFTEYVIDNVFLSARNNSNPYEIQGFAGDSLSEISFRMKFHRDIGYYLLDFFIPSYLLVFTSWVTFWLRADATPPRAVIGVSPIVAFITLQLGVTSTIPKVSYVKASDVWFLAIMTFLFLSLAEFAFSNVVWRRNKQIELKKPTSKYIVKGAVMPRKARNDLRRYESSEIISSIESLGSMKTTPEGYYHGSGDISISVDDGNPGSTWTIMTPNEVSIFIDRKARIVFPITFLIFNILYWTFVYCL